MFPAPDIKNTETAKDKSLKRNPKNQLSGILAKVKEKCDGHKGFPVFTWIGALQIVYPWLAH